VVAQEGRNPEIFVVSDGTGETAAAAVQAALTQFSAPLRLRNFGEVLRESDVRRVMELAAESGAVVVFTLVEEGLTRAIVEHGLERGVPTVDLLGPLITTIASHCRVEPQHRSGLLHRFSDDYFRRVESVEFAVRHDDGANPHTLFDAHLVLTGVSRTSKTPLSMYLAQRGYKTGNVPLVPGVDPPRELLDLDPRKVFGLVVDESTLLEIRRARVQALRASPYLTYADPEGVSQELRRARRLFRMRGWRLVDITARAVEENAARILELYRAARGGG
jgi:regulator of PEP synthase PpsR (kinase-PPPase family)